VAAAYEHEDIGRLSGDIDLVDIVMLANLHSYIGKNHRLSKVDWGNVPAFAKLGLTPTDSLLALEAAKAEMAEMRAMLGG
jgi:hypothetical protein